MTDQLLTTKEHTEAHGDKIAGYRKLTDDEIERINGIKQIGNDLGGLLDLLQASPSTDKRWLAIAKTDLQTGIMALVRSVAKPAGF